MSSDRNPGFLSTLNELQAGDIILLRAPINPGRIQRGIMILQSVVGQRHGHFDTTHAAICTGRGPDGRPLIAHLTGHNVMGYKQEPLEDVIKRDGGDRAFVVYRPNNQHVAANIARTASNKSNESIKWNIPAAAGLFLRFAALSPDRKLSGKISKAEKGYAQDSCCSKFAIQTIKIATDPRNPGNSGALEEAEYYPDIRSSSTPKALEAMLYKDKQHYSMHVYTGKQNPYLLIIDDINNQIARIGKRTDKESINKCQELKKQLHEITTRLESSKPELNNLQKAIQLLKEISPALKQNTGLNLRTPESYRAVMDKARSMGIFKRDLEEPEKPIPSTPKRRM